MKKPLNKFAIALWMIALIFAVSDVWSLYTTLCFASDVQGAYGAHTYIVSGTIWRIVQSAVMMCSVLIALGILIEMVDQIRWSVTNREK